MHAFCGEKVATTNSRDKQAEIRHALQLPEDFNETVKNKW
jgi:hypothetical protein